MLSSDWPASRCFYQVLPWLGVGLQLTHSHSSFKRHSVDTCCMPVAVLSLYGKGPSWWGLVTSWIDTANEPKLKTVLGPLGPSVTLGLWEGSRQKGEVERLKIL